MSRPRLRALVLAAGRGDRLRPLTDFTPKPLLPVAGEPIAGATLRRLAAAGCEAAALNLHHLGEQIRAHFGAEYAGVPLTYSSEPELLGTLGALYPLRGFLAEADVILLLNGDSLCRWPLEQLVRRHRQRGADATLLLHSRISVASFGGGVGVDRRDRITSFRRATAEGEVRRGVFAGAHALSPRLLERIPEGPSDIISALYEPLLAEGGRLEALWTARRWHDLGTPERYLDGVLESATRSLGRSSIAVGALVDAGARVRASVLETGAVIERDAEVEHAVLLTGTSVGEGARLSRVVLGHGVAVPAGARIESMLVTREQLQSAPPASSRVEMGLVLTPLAGHRIDP
ncbi:MAG: NDP-sugar synthase [Acidobacteriota bacterium]